MASSSNESTSLNTTSTTNSNKEQYQTHQRSCSMEPSVMTPEDNLNGIIPGFQRPPEICVDYLSHDWKVEDDIWTSWKVMSKQKKEIDNGIRLENASWRTWAKQKYKLKTVNPESLNWHKDSDVTWLYGPLHTAWLPHKKENEQKLSTTASEFNLSSGYHKSCLKKKSMSEILRPSVKSRLVTSNSDTQLYNKNQNDGDVSDCDSASTCSSISGPTTPITGPTKSILLPTGHEDQSPPRNHIRFNDQVEQCIAVDSADGEDDQINASEQDISSSDEDEGLQMKISRKKKDCTTIFKLAPTKLKSDRLYSNEYSTLYTKQSQRRKPASSPNSASYTPPATTSANSSSFARSSSAPSWIDDEDDDDLDVDDLDISLFDFDKPAPISSSTHLSSGIIRHPSSLWDPNNQEQQPHEPADDDQGLVDRAVNIASNFREIVNWCSTLVFN